MPLVKRLLAKEEDLCRNITVHYVYVCVCNWSINVAHHIFVCNVSALSLSLSDAQCMSILMLIRCSTILSCLFRLFNALTSLWMAGPVCHLERECVLWSQSDMQRVAVLDMKIIKMLSLLI